MSSSKSSPRNWRTYPTENNTVSRKSKNYLGLMRKAGKLLVGEMLASDAVKEGRAKLLLLPSDVSESARGRAQVYLTGHRALIVDVPYTNAELSQLLGKGGCSMAAVTDIGLASAFLDALEDEEPGKYTELAQEVKKRKEKAARRKAAGPKSKSGRNKA